MKIAMLRKTGSDRLYPLHNATLFACGSIALSEYGYDYVFEPDEYEIVDVDVYSKCITHEEYKSNEVATLEAILRESQIVAKELESELKSLKSKMNDVFGEEETTRLLSGPDYQTVFKCRKHGIDCGDVLARNKKFLRAFADITLLYSKTLSTQDRTKLMLVILGATR
jgi:hypothetical protein